MADEDAIDWKRYESDMAYHAQVNKEQRERRWKQQAAAEADDWITEPGVQRWNYEMLQKWERERRKADAEREAARDKLNRDLRQQVIDAWRSEQERLGHRGVLFDEYGRPIASVNTPLPRRVERTRRREREMDFG
jgi:hypothetical protein